MSNYKLVTYVIILITGFGLVGLLHRSELGVSVEKSPPPLSEFPMHKKYVSDEICLQCHITEKTLEEFDLVSPAMPHEPRKNCVSCHRLPS